jgi:DNA-binding HxlR family transcriptional regulator
MLGTILEESLNMSIESIEQDKLENTGFNYTLSLINGKYKMTILYYLTAFDVVRFNEMKRYIGTVSFKTLSLSLKELESDGLIIRNEYPQIPPKVEYSLSARGKSLIPILEAMCEWGEFHKTTAKKK